MTHSNNLQCLTGWEQRGLCLEPVHVISHPGKTQQGGGGLGFVWFAASFVRQMAEDPMEKTAILNITFNKVEVIG